MQHTSANILFNVIIAFSWVMLSSWAWLCRHICGNQTKFLAISEKTTALNFLCIWGPLIHNGRWLQGKPQKATQRPAENELTNKLGNTHKHVVLQV